LSEKLSSYQKILRIKIQNLRPKINNFKKCGAKSKYLTPSYPLTKNCNFLSTQLTQLAKKWGAFKIRKFRLNSNTYRFCIWQKRKK